MRLIAEIVIATAEADVLLQCRVIVDALGSVAFFIVEPTTLHLDVHGTWGLWLLVQERKGEWVN